MGVAALVSFLGSTGLCSPVLLRHVARGTAWHVRSGLCVKYLKLSSAIMELLQFLQTE